MLSFISRNCAFKNNNNQPFIAPLKKESKNIDIFNNILNMKNDGSSLGSSLASLFGNSEKNILEEISNNKSLFSSNENLNTNTNTNILNDLKTELPEDLLNNSLMKLLSSCDFMKMI